MRLASGSSPPSCRPGQKRTSTSSCVCCKSSLAVPSRHSAFASKRDQNRNADKNELPMVRSRHPADKSLNLLGARFPPPRFCSAKNPRRLLLRFAPVRRLLARLPRAAQLLFQVVPDEAAKDLRRRQVFQVADLLERGFLVRVEQDRQAGRSIFERHGTLVESNVRRIIIK